MNGDAGNHIAMRDATPVEIATKIRALLRHTFAGVRFSVSGAYERIDVEWANNEGPNERQVQQVVLNAGLAELWSSHGDYLHLHANGWINFQFYRFNASERAVERLRIEQNREPASIAKTAIRRELAQLFPDVKFTVRKAQCLVNVEWLGGPLADEVRRVIDKYKVEDRNELRRRCLLVANRLQTCPRCRSDVPCNDPAEFTCCVCCVCDP
jgi:Large polyvalent protein associated domain 29